MKIEPFAEVDRSCLRHQDVHAVIERLAADRVEGGYFQGTRGAPQLRL